jgi:hypothetical protein
LNIEHLKIHNFSISWQLVSLGWSPVCHAKLRVQLAKQWTRHFASRVAQNLECCFLKTKANALATASAHRDIGWISTSAKSAHKDVKNAKMDNVGFVMQDWDTCLAKMGVA